MNRLTTNQFKIITEDPFTDYPDFGRVLDQMAEKGLHLYYYRVRTTFKDEGTRWREKWEHNIRSWMRKARNWDIFNHFFDKGLLSASLIGINTFLNDRKLIEIIEKIRRAFQAQKDLMDFQNCLLLNAKINYPPIFTDFLEESLAYWKKSNGREISLPFFEVAPKGTMEQLKEVGYVLQFLENTSPIGKMDGLPVHSSEVLEYVRLWLRSILGLPTDNENLWSVRDVREIYGWTRMGKKLRCEANPRANLPVMRA